MVVGIVLGVVSMAVGVLLGAVMLAVGLYAMVYLPGFWAWAGLGAGVAGLITCWMALSLELN